MNAFNISKIESPDDFSFYIGPAMNAAGRMGKPNITLELLLEDEPEKASAMAKKLLGFNQERKVVEKQAVLEALAIISEKRLDLKNGICVFGDGWNEGVIGIISGRLKEKFNKPTFVISFNKDGIGRGSSRSVASFHIGHFLEKARSENVIITGGGHALAGGFSIYKDKIRDFIDFVDLHMKYDFVNNLRIDYSISVNSDFKQIHEEISLLTPFGMGIENPIFVIRRLRVKYKKVTKLGTNLMLTFSGVFGDGLVQAIIFGISGKSGFIELIDKNLDNLIDIAGHISISKYGKSFVIKDARLSA
jgi:single-stranded-DNA-specific exonuclease